MHQVTLQFKMALWNLLLPLLMLFYISMHTMLKVAVFYYTAICIVYALSVGSNHDSYQNLHTPFNIL